MISRRLGRRLVRHHLTIAVMSAASLILCYALVRSPNAMHRWSMSTAYVGLALLAATLIIGPLNLLRRRPNPVSTDLRRDIGIWAGLLAIVHFVIGLQVHMKHRYLYWFTDSEDGGRLLPRTDIFGFANDTGIAAVVIAAILVIISNDYFLRRFRAERWKGLQQWNYAFFVLVVAHGIAFQVIEKRQIPWVAAMTVITLSVIGLQIAGYMRSRRRIP
jgi:sulfoxide reductase heme-binding subunit YedZ